MSVQFPTPLHYDLLMQGKRALNNVKPLIAKAEACGVDCQSFNEGHGYLGSQIDSFLREFFPDKITPPLPPGVPPSYE